MQLCYAKEREARPFLQYGGADHMGPGRGWNANHVARRGWLRGRGRNTAEPPRARLLTGHAPQPLWGPVRGGGVEPSSWPFTPAWLRPWDRWSSGDLVRPLAERWADKAAWLRSWPEVKACSQPWPRRVGHCRAGGLGSLGVHSGPEGFRDPPPAWAEILCDLITVSQPPRASFSSLLGHMLPNPWDGKSWSAHAWPFTALGLLWDWTGGAAQGLGVQVRKSDCLD